MATAPRPQKPGGDDEDATMSVKVDGELYVVHIVEITAQLAGQLRRQSGLSVQGIMSAAGSDPDLDVVASVVWLARRQRGENVSWEKVAASISYGSDIDEDVTQEDIKAAEDPDSPEL